MEFRYVAVNSQGERLTGVSYAKSRNDLKVQLNKVNVHLVSCKPNWITLWQRKSKLPTSFMIEFSRQMSILLSAGITVTQALQIILSEQKDRPLQIFLSNLLNSVQQGSSLSSAISYSGFAVDKQYTGVIFVGEESGHLVSAFEQNFQYLSDKQALSKKVKQACTYPLIVLTIALIVIALLLVKVIPGFQSLFSNFDQELPLVTQFVISLSMQVQTHWFDIILGIVVLAIAMFGALRIKLVKYWFDKSQLSVPVLGTLLKFHFYTSYALSCHNLLKAGIPLHQAIGDIKLSTDNVFLMKRLTVIELQLRSGNSFHLACQQSEVFSPLFTQLVQVGEESGSLDTRLHNLAAIYKEKLDDHITQVVKLIEPAIMLLTGLLIGGLVLVMYLPIFQMSAFL